MPLDLTVLRSCPVDELLELARPLGIDNASGLRKSELIFEVVRRQPGAEAGAIGEGVLEILPDGFGFLRSPNSNYLPGPDDIYVSPSQIRRFQLRTGDCVRGLVRAPKEGERYFALIKIQRINDRAPDAERDKRLFDNLTPVHPDQPLRLAAGPDDLGARFVELLAPIGRGQRVALYAPRHAGRTRLLHELIAGIRAHQPEIPVLLVLIDERPEEVTQTVAEVDAEVLSSTFEEPAARHVQVAEMALERAKRMVEQGRDVVLVIDSLSRLGRALQAVAPPGGRLLEGVADVGALHRCRRMFGTGRNLREGGSLTLIATLLTGTGAQLDEVLREELDGAASTEIHLCAELAECGVFPAIDVHRTASRRVRVLMGDEGAAARFELHRRMPSDRASAVAWLRDRVRRHATNEALLAEICAGAPDPVSSASE